MLIWGSFQDFFKSRINQPTTNIGSHLYSVHGIGFGLKIFHKSAPRWAFTHLFSFSPAAFLGAYDN